MARFLARMCTAVAGSDAPNAQSPFTDIDYVPADARVITGLIFQLDVMMGTTVSA